MSRRLLLVLFASTCCLSAQAVEPGLRVKAGLGALKLLGTVGDDIEVGGAEHTIGVGGFADVSYRITETFALGARYTRHMMGISATDGDSLDSASFSEVMVLATLVFNPDEDARPFATAGLGLSWLGWRYATRHQPYPDEPDFTFDDDRRRATTFLFGGGAEIAMGEQWELAPAFHVRMHGWSDHTERGIPQLDDEEQWVAPTTVSLEVTVGVTRRF